MESSLLAWLALLIASAGIVYAISVFMIIAYFKTKLRYHRTVIRDLEEGHN